MEALISECPVLKELCSIIQMVIGFSPRRCAGAWWVNKKNRAHRSVSPGHLTYLCKTDLCTFTWKKNKLSSVGQILDSSQSTFHSQEILHLYEVLMQRRGRSVVPLLQVQLDRYFQHVVLRAWALPPIAAPSISWLEWGSHRQSGVQLNLVASYMVGNEMVPLTPINATPSGYPKPKGNRPNQDWKQNNFFILYFCLFYLYFD